MLEFGFLSTEADRLHAARLIDQGGVPWIKQSSGWGEGGIAATVEDIRFLRETVSLHCKVKGSSEVNTYEKAIAMFEAGAETIGTSSAPQITDHVAGSTTGY